MLTHLLQQAIFLQPLNSSLAKLATALCALVKGGRKLTPQAGKFPEAFNMQLTTNAEMMATLQTLKSVQKSDEKSPRMEMENESPRTKDSFSKSSFLGSRFVFWGGIHPRARRRRTVAWFLHQSHSKSCRIVCCDFVFQGVIKYYLYPHNALCSIEITPNRHTFACVWIPPQQKNRVTL